MEHSRSEPIHTRFRRDSATEQRSQDLLGEVAEVSRLRGNRQRIGSLLRGAVHQFGHQRVRYFPQVQHADCGAACLASVLDYFGLDFDIDKVRLELGVGRDGVSARKIVEVANRFDLAARGVRTTLEGLRQLPTGTILFWDYRHFVVLESFEGATLVVVDPAHGRRRLTYRDADHAFTGVAIEFFPQAGADRSKRNTGSHGSHFWARLRYFLPRARRSWLVAGLTSLALVAFNLALPFLTGSVVQLASDQGNISAPLAMLVGGLVAVSVAFFALQTARGLAITRLQSVMDKESTIGLVGSLMRLPYAFFERRHAGDLMQRARTSLRIRNIVSSITLSAAFDAIIVLLYMALLFSQHWLVATVAVGLATLLIGTIALSWRHLWDLAATSLDAQVDSNNKLIESLDGMLTVKALGAEPEITRRWLNAFARDVTAGTAYRRGIAWVSAAILTVQFIAPIAMLVVSYLLLQSGSLEIGQLVALSTIMIGFFAPLGSFCLAFIQMASLGPELARVADVVDAEPERSGSLRVATQRPQPILLTDVEFTYEGATRSSVAEINLAVPARSYMGLIGPSGSGKSTIAALIAGIYTPTEGSITVGDVDLRDANRSAYREGIGYVDQNSRLFAGSILENLTLSQNGASRENVQRASSIAELDHVVEELPMGYETMLGSGGVGLSGGQRQRIALARALLSEPKILILDEATSAVDPETEARIFANLRKLDCTLIVAAHRLGLVTAADQIAVVRAGRVVEVGTPDEIDSAGSGLLQDRGTG